MIHMVTTNFFALTLLAIKSTAICTSSNPLPTTSAGGIHFILPSSIAKQMQIQATFQQSNSPSDSCPSITSQPITLSFRHEGRARRYTPDFLVRWGSRRTELIEIKYQADLDANEEELRPAFDAACAWANQSGAVFRTVTEREIAVRRW